MEVPHIMGAPTDEKKSQKDVSEQSIPDEAVMPSQEKPVAAAQVSNQSEIEEDYEF